MAKGPRAAKSVTDGQLCALIGDGAPTDERATESAIPTMSFLMDQFLLGSARAGFRRPRAECVLAQTYCPPSTQAKQARSKQAVGSAAIAARLACVDRAAQRFGGRPPPTR